MSKETVYMSDLWFDHNVWINELEFMKDEVKIFERRLEELVVKYTNKEMLAELEHFQNTFIRQKEIIDEYEHEIGLHTKELEKFAKDHPVALDHIHFKDHKIIREKMNSNREIYNQTKNDFFRFLSKWM